MIDVRRAGLRLSGDGGLLDRALVHHWLSTDSYWAMGRDRATMDTAIAGSECVGIYREDDRRQVAFARVVTDGAVFAYLCDVYVDPDFRGAGLGRWMVGALRDELRKRGVRRFLLATATAHGVYAPLGFEAVAPGDWMVCELQRLKPGPGEPGAGQR
ncbi:GNAT family N-acetyltransferase [Actinoplanes sp. RD1]|uniref:GNAT family N-acetyltransferase n=1 Tax=Actinoplanes sp. RD1 TaxID=3064538 RepID=UPI002740F971|nr:GNAT family N-acetyltransferase [Actinoplanes sp. RD1]